MIITKLIGGLGNQMFQYALGRNLAHRLGGELKLDLSGFRNYKLRQYELSVFNIQGRFASDEDLRALPVTEEGILSKISNRLVKKTASPDDPLPVKEKDPGFDPGILTLKGNIHLDGYWQNEKYFSDIEGIIRQEFTFKTPQTGRNKELAELIASTESVSVHVRRGDYVSNPKTHQYHGTCDPDYYLRGVDFLSPQISNIHLFIFSDDPRWCRNNLELAYPVTFVEHNKQENSYEDLRLMSQCKHHIIANSSFSWWGAWLNTNKNKIVIAPKIWFRSEELNSRYATPQSWVRLP